MGVDFYVYVGPYLAVSEKKLSKIDLCATHNRRDTDRFCPECGNQNRYKTQKIYLGDITEDFNTAGDRDDILLPSDYLDAGGVSLDAGELLNLSRTYVCNKLSKFYKDYKDKIKKLEEFYDIEVHFGVVPMVSY